MSTTREIRTEDMQKVLFAVAGALLLATAWWWLGALVAAAHGDWGTAAYKTVGTAFTGRWWFDMAKREARYRS